MSIYKNVQYASRLLNQPIPLLSNRYRSPWKVWFAEFDEIHPQMCKYWENSYLFWYNVQVNDFKLLLLCWYAFFCSPKWNIPLTREVKKYYTYFTETWWPRKNFRTLRMFLINFHDCGIFVIFMETMLLYVVGLCDPLIQLKLFCVFDRSQTGYSSIGLLKILTC